MLKLKIFFACLTVLFFLFSMVVCVEVYTMERAFARGVFTDLLDEMQDKGYLDDQLALYYATKMTELGWQQVEQDFYRGTWPREEVQRAKKELHQSVFLSLHVRPSRVSQWFHLFLSGETVFRLTGSRPSEYFDPGW